MQEYYQIIQKIIKCPDTVKRQRKWNYEIVYT